MYPASITSMVITIVIPSTLHRLSLSSASPNKSSGASAARSKLFNIPIHGKLCVSG